MICFLVPGPIANLTVTEVTLTLVNVTWDPPASPNGNITEYEVKFYSADGEFSLAIVSHLCNQGETTLT